MTNTQALDRFFEAVAEYNLYSSPRNLQFYLHYLFQDVNLTGKKVLEIGAGAGLCSCYAASSGAEKVISLEPEAAGSTAGVTDRFNKLSNALGLSQVAMYPLTFQDFDPGNEKFDVILLDDCVNHLDEAACVDLLRDAGAIEAYRNIFHKMYDIAADRAKIIITDCSRHNFFALLKRRNPFSPTIEWHKHQAPVTWMRLLADAGFVNPMVKWASFNRLGSVGRLLGNKPAAFFLQSRFRIEMEKRPLPIEARGSSPK